VERLPRGEFGNKPRQDQQWNCKNRSDDEAQDQQENPILPRMPARIGDVEIQKAIVSPVRFPENIESVSKDWNSADEKPDRHVGQHANESDAGNAANPGCEGNEKREARRDYIAQARHKSNDTVKAEADSRARDAKRFVKDVLDPVEAVVAQPAPSRCKSIARRIFQRFSRARGPDGSGYSVSLAGRVGKRLGIEYRQGGVPFCAG